jgi:type IV pilus assembly protein PilB
MEKPKQQRLGQILIENKLITDSQLNEALALQGESGKSLGRILIDTGVLSEGQLTAVLAEQIGIRYIDLHTYSIDPSATALIDRSLALRYTVVPIDLQDGRLIVAMADPTNVFALDDLRIMTGKEILPVVSTAADITDIINRYMLQNTVPLEEQLEEVPVPEDFEGFGGEEPDEEEFDEDVDDAPVVKYVNLIIQEAVHENASDVHIEPGEKEVRIRYRVDGVLHETRRSPRRIHPGLVSRIKILANMNIAERRIPQDGRFHMNASGKQVDLRVASLPTVYGEKIVLRILDRSSLLISLTDLGLGPEPLKHFSDSFNKPYGTVIVTGPTGSGKTTTMYAAMTELNHRDVNVITVEDPVEYQMQGLNQVQVNTKVGLTFGASLRSILRCDPDIVMIGEIRDPESAKMAIESALTGHMVLCTLHTNDAPSAMTRMTEMGVEPFLIASAVDCVVSQRLARRLCTRCKQQTEYDVKYLQKVGYPPGKGDTATMYKAKPGGCPFCSGAGFRGRVGLFEVLSIDEDIERLVVNVSTAHEIARKAREKGMMTLRDDGFLKVKQGITSLEEVLRVVM